MIDRDELQRLWTGSTLSLRSIAAYFHTTEGVVAGHVRRARKAEGQERWPKRHSPVIHSASAPPPRRVRLKPGTATLPPLRSLDQ